MIRFYGCTDTSIWHDELRTLLESFAISYNTPPEPEIITTQYYKNQVSFTNIKNTVVEIEGGNTFGYILSLHIWGNTFGISDVSLNLFSIFFGLLAIVLVWKILSITVKSNIGKVIGLSFFTIHGHFVEMSEFVRTYSFTIFFLLLATYYSLVIINRQKSNWTTYLAFFGSAIIAFSGHFISILPLAILSSFLLINKYREWSKLLVIGLLGIGFIIPYYHNLIEPGSRFIKEREQAWQQKINNNINDLDNSVVRPATLKYLAGGFMQAFATSAGLTLQNSGYRLREFIPLIVISSVVSLFFLVVIYANRKKLFASKNVVVVTFFGVLGLFLVVSILKNNTLIFGPNYQSFTAPFYVLSMALVMDYLSNKKIRAAFFSLLAILFFTNTLFTGVPYPTGPKIKNPYYKLAKEISENKNIRTIEHKSFGQASIINLYLSKMPNREHINSLNQQINPNLKPNEINTNNLNNYLR